MSIAVLIEAMANFTETMKLRCHLAMVVSLCVAALGLSGCDDSYTWNQKLTVEVETPDGVKTGSSVQKISLSTYSAFGQSGRSASASRRGEAVVVELTPDRFLFLLIADGDNLAQYAVLDKTMLNTYVEKRGKQLVQVGRKGVLPRNQYPSLVTFDDITKPETASLVHPDDLTSAFGEGYALKSITLEITDEVMTTGRVESVLGWWRNYWNNNFRLNGKKCTACPISSENVADMLGAADFKLIQ